MKKIMTLLTIVCLAIFVIGCGLEESGTENTTSSDMGDLSNSPDDSSKALLDAAANAEDVRKGKRIEAS